MKTTAASDADTLKASARTIATAGKVTLTASTAHRVARGLRVPAGGRWSDHQVAPVKATSHTASVTHAYTRTSTGSCIAGGQFCKQAMYGQIGYDASGRSWRCTGDRTHPHWM